MNTQQLQTLKAAILADQELATIGRNDTEMARVLNLPTAFVVWRSSVSQDEIMQNGFDWVQVDNLTVGKARIWEWLFDNEQRSINPSKVNVRAGIDEAWKGTSAMLAVRAAVYTHCKRSATRVEQLLGSGTGTDATPGSLGFEGSVSINDLAEMWNQG